jgi:molybdenum cofactor cytidylyltransferase
VKDLQNQSLSNVMALVLAGGQSRRFGSDKRRVVMPDGGLLINAILRRLRKAGVPASVALPANDSLAAELEGDYLICPDTDQGMGRTIANAVSQLQRQSDIQAIMIMPVDLPLIRVSTLRAIAQRAEGGSIMVPSSNGRQGHPVCFGRAFFPLLTQLQGDEGAKKIIHGHQHKVVTLAVDDSGIYEDGDDSEAMAMLIARLEPKRV